MRFFFGINYNCNSDVIRKLKDCKLNKYITISTPQLYCKSDASGYQAAMLGLKKSQKKYDQYWFGHTKGGVNERAERRKYYISEFFERRNDIELDILNNDVGVYGLHAVCKSSDGFINWKNYPISLDHGEMPIIENVKFNALTYKRINVSFVETFFVMSGHPVNWFIENVKDSWFYEKLKDRYYFEVTFPWLASRYGMSTFIKNQEDFCTPLLWLPQIQLAKKLE